MSLRKDTQERVLIVLQDPTTGDRVAGVVAADHASTRLQFVKGDGSTVLVTLVDNTNWFEIDATNSPGCYHFVLLNTQTNVLGQLGWTCMPAASKFKTMSGSDTVTSELADIAAVFARLGAPAGASMSADIASAYARLGAPAGASMSADIAAVKTDTAAVKTKTDNLPASPANEATSTAIKAKTDALPPDPADASDVAAGVSAAVVAIKGADNRDLSQLAGGTWAGQTLKAIGDKTVNLPGDPADASDVTAQIGTLTLNVQQNNSPWPGW